MHTQQTAQEKKRKNGQTDEPQRPPEAKTREEETYKKAKKHPVVIYCRGYTCVDLLERLVSVGAMFHSGVRCTRHLCSKQRPPRGYHGRGFRYPDAHAHATPPLFSRQAAAQQAHRLQQNARRMFKKPKTLSVVVSCGRLPLCMERGREVG